MEILKKPKNALTKQFRKLFEIDGVELEFEDDALKAVAKLAIEQKREQGALGALLNPL